jgi:hypothetical protein
MTILILESRGGKRVGKLDTHRLLQRHPDIQTSLPKPKDALQLRLQPPVALFENHELIGACLCLVHNMRPKYGVLNFNNFDETEFIMGLICQAIIVTPADRRSRDKCQPGNRESATAIRCINGEGWSVPPFLVI